MTVSPTPTQQIGMNVSDATAFPRKVAEGGARVGLNVVTAGGAGGIERAVAEGRASPGDLSSLASAYTEGNASFLTAGGVDAYVEARAGQGRGQVGSVMSAGGAAVVNVTPYEEVKTVFDPNASGYDKVEAVISGGLKVAAGRAVVKRGYSVIKESRSTRIATRPAASTRPAGGYASEGGEFVGDGLRMTEQPLAPRNVRAGRLARNRAAGKAHESRVAARARATRDNVAEQVQIVPNTATGPADFWTIPDTMGTNRLTGVLELEDAKASRMAPLTPRQTEGYPLIGEYGGTVRGTGVKVPPTKVKIVTPEDLD